MATNVPYIFYKNDAGDVQITAGKLNSPDWKEIDYNTYKSIANNTGYYNRDTGQWSSTKPSNFGEYGGHYTTYNTNRYEQALNSPEYGALLKSYEQGTAQPSSGYIIDDNGNFTTQSHLDADAANEAAVAAGTMKKVPIGSGFGYIPVGSAASTNPLGVQAVNNNPVTTQNATTQNTQNATTQTTQADEIASKIKTGERAILPDGRQFLKEADGTFRWIENPQVLGELTNAGKVTGGMTQVSSESALGKIGSTLTMSEANGSDDLAIEKAIREIYQTNFGRQPTQSELDNQKNAINTGGQAAFDNLVNWAKTHPQNISVTGKVSLPQTSQGEALQPLDNTDDLVSQLPTELQSLYTQMSDYVQTLIDQGKQVNPNIEITPEMISQFEQQAMTEYKDYFSGEELGTLTDLKRTLDRNIQLNQQSEQDITRQFGTDYRGIGETAANQGITSSGERLRSEQELADEANRQIQRNREALQFGGEGLSLTAERNIGSSALNNFAFPTLSSTPTATAQGNINYTGGATNLGSVRGDIFGTLPSEEKTAISQRTSQLEEIQRTRNLLSL
jgi:hypothetical protein